MIKLLLFRVLPLGAAVGIFAGALSPLRPALETFGAAADALAGEKNVQSTFQTPQLPAALTGVPESKQGSKAKKSLQVLASQLRGNEAPSSDPYGEERGARAPKPIAPPPAEPNRRRSR